MVHGSFGRLGYFKTCTSAETCSSCHSTRNIWKLNFFRPKGNKTKRKMLDFVAPFLAQPEPKGIFVFVFVCVSVYGWAVGF